MSKYDLKDKITDLFEYTLDNKEILYRGLNGVTFDEKYNEISWFSFDKNTANTYAKNKNGKIYSFKPKKQNIKLVNINSMFFRMHLMDLINMNYLNDDKVPIFSAIGIPNLESIQYVIDTRFKDKPINSCTDLTSDLTKKMKLYAEYLGGHRLSETATDKIFAATLQTFYGKKFDGYISPLNWATCYHKNFPPEICLFEPKNILRYTGNENYIPLSIGGMQTNGSVKPPNIWSTPWGSWDSHNCVFEEDYNTRMINQLKKLNWKKPLVYDENGKLIMPDMNEITKNTINSLFDRTEMKDLMKIPGFTPAEKKKRTRKKSIDN